MPPKLPFLTRSKAKKEGTKYEWYWGVGLQTNKENSVDQESGEETRENSAPSIENRLENESDDNLSLEWDGEYDKNSPPKENEDDEDLEFEGICRHRRPHRNLLVCVNLFEQSESEGSEK